MEITFLGVVFAVIIVLLAIGRPLYQAIAGGMIVTAGLFHIPVTVIVTKIASVIINWSSLSVLLSLYLITFLQRILESRSQIRLAHVKKLLKKLGVTHVTVVPEQEKPDGDFPTCRALP